MVLKDMINTVEQALALCNRGQQRYVDGTQVLESLIEQGWLRCTAEDED